MGGACLLALFAFARTVHPFLAVHAPVPADTLVIEGWLPEYAMAQTVAEFRRGGYERVIVAGWRLTVSAPGSNVDRCPPDRVGHSPDKIDVVIIPAVGGTARRVRREQSETG